MVIYNKTLSKQHKVVKDRIREKNKGSIYIPYPSTESEAEITAYILSYLLLNKVDARAEVTAKDGNSRFDIVIFKEKVAQRIIEVKKSKGILTNIQRDKYLRFKLPVDHVKGMKNAKKYLETVLNTINSQEKVEERKPSRKKITEEFQPCRKCDTPVIKVVPQRRERKVGQAYYFKSYLKCPACHTMYMQESEKVFN